MEKIKIKNNISFVPSEKGNDRNKENFNTKAIISQRDHSIDFARGIAIILMVFTHVNGLMYLEPKAPLDWITFAGATVCFSLFLFCFSYAYGLKAEKGYHYFKEIKRILLILLVYFILGFIAYFFLHGEIVNIVKLITFQVFPEFTEFLIAFVLTGLLFLLIGKYLVKLKKYTKTIITVAIISYVLAIFLSKLDFGIFNNLKALTFGDTNIHAFPIFAYMPIALLGFFWSHIEETYKSKISLIVIALFSFFSLTIINTTALGGWYRWPPSISFILWGVFAVALSIFFYKISPMIIRDIITRIGRHSLSAFIISTISIIGVYYIVGWTQYPAYFVIIISLCNLGFLYIYDLLVEGIKINSRKIH